MNQIPAIGSLFYGRLVDSMVRGELTEDRFDGFYSIVIEKPVVPKYDPEDFDPEEISREEEQEKVREMGQIFAHPLVGAVQIGGSYDVNSSKVGKTLEIIERAENQSEEVYKLLEPGSPGDLQDAEGEFDLELLTAPDVINKPQVWNTYDSEWKDRKHSKAQHLLGRLASEKADEALVEKVKSELEEVLPDRLKPFIDPDRIASGYTEWVESPENYLLEGLDNRIIPESYLVVNPDSAVAEKTGSEDWLFEEVVLPYWNTPEYIKDQVDGEVEEIETRSETQILAEEASSMAAERKQNGYNGVLYVEGSGKLSPTEIVESAYTRLNREITDSNDILVAYGGGISREEDIENYLNAGADFVLVGNSIQEQGPEALPDPEEVQGVK